MKVRMSKFVKNCKTVDIVIALNVIYKYWNRNIGPAESRTITGTHI